MPEIGHVGNLPMPYFDQRPDGQRLVGVVVIPGSSHDLPAEHFENSNRTDEMVELLREQPFWDDLYVFYPRLASPEQLALVHDKAHVDLVRNCAAAGPGWLDSDTLVSPGTYDGAAVAAGAVLNAIDAVGMVAYHRLDHVFALVRPCGHHCGPRRAQGSGIFNNVAIGARYAQHVYGYRRIAIVDWDVHHGNGTQEVFYDDPDVFFCSLHEYPGYPGTTGWVDEVGEGAGVGYNLNAPMPAGASDAAYLAAFDEVLLPILRSFEPELVLVSVGHDSHASDPTGNVDLTTAGIQGMTRRTRDLAEGASASSVFVLEGGYNQNTLPLLTTSLVAALGEFDVEIDDLYAASAIDERPEDRERIEAMREAMRPHWPVVAAETGE